MSIIENASEFARRHVGKAVVVAATAAAFGSPNLATAREEASSDPALDSANRADSAAETVQERLGQEETTLLLNTIAIPENSINAGITLINGGQYGADQFMNLINGEPQVDIADEIEANENIASRFALSGIETRVNVVQDQSGFKAVPALWHEDTLLLPSPDGDWLYTMPEDTPPGDGVIDFLVGPDGKALPFRSTVFPDGSEINEILVVGPDSLPRYQEFLLPGQVAPEMSGQLVRFGEVDRGINVRRGPSTTTSINQTTDRTLNVSIEAEAINTRGEEWLAVSVGGEQIGWVWEELVSEIPPVPEPPTSDPEETPVAPRAREIFEAANLTSFPELPQISSSDGRVNIFYSDGYLATETPGIRSFSSKEDTSDEVIDYILDRAFSRANNDPANVNGIPVELDGVVTLAPYTQRISPNRADANSLTGTLSRINQYVVGFDEYNMLVNLFREDLPRASDYAERLGINLEGIQGLGSSSLPDHVGLYINDLAIGFGYFKPDGTVVIVNHALRRVGDRRPFRYANIVADGPSTLLTILEKSLTYEGGGQVGLSRFPGTTNNDPVYHIYGCYESNGGCSSAPPPTLEVSGN